MIVNFVYSSKLGIRAAAPVAKYRKRTWTINKI